MIYTMVMFVNTRTTYYSHKLSKLLKPVLKKHLFTLDILLDYILLEYININILDILFQHLNSLNLARYYI